jgi:hypothetical protein
MFSGAELREINKDHAHLLGLGKGPMPYNNLDISFKKCQSEQQFHTKWGVNMARDLHHTIPKATPLILTWLANDLSAYLSLDR